MPRVVVFGSSNTDMTVRLPRLPAPGQTVLGYTFSTTAGGKGANQAVAARRAGGEVSFVTAVGDDDLGREALALYQREGIDVSHARRVCGIASGVALIFIADDGENMIGVAPGANHALCPGDVDHLPEALFRGGGVLLAGLEIPVATALRAIERGRQAGMRVILNPAPAPAHSIAETAALLQRADVVTPNRSEALALAGMDLESAGEPDWDHCVERLFQAGARAVVITLGARGALAAEGAKRTWLAAPQVDAVDTVGAGDAFNGALAVALAEKRPLAEAAGWAVVAAGLAVTQPGAQTALPVRDAIDRMAARWGQA
jgi:ribokinase